MTAAILALALAAAPFNSPGIVGPRGATGVIVGGDEEGNVLIDGGTLWVSDGAAHNMITLGKDGTITAGQVNATGLSTDGGAGLVVLDGTGHVVATISASGTEWLANTLGVDGGATVKGTVNAIALTLDGGAFTITNGAGTSVFTVDGDGDLTSPADYSGWYTLGPASLGQPGTLLGISGTIDVAQGSDGGMGSVEIDAHAGRLGLFLSNPGALVDLASNGDDTPGKLHHWIQGAGAGTLSLGDKVHIDGGLDAPFAEFGAVDAGSIHGTVGAFSTSLTVAGVGVVGGAPLSMNGYQLAALGTGVGFGFTKAPSAGHIRTATYTPQLAGVGTGVVTVGVYDGSTKLCDFDVSCVATAGTPVNAPAGNCDDGGATQAYAAGDGVGFKLVAETCSVSNPTGDASAQGN